jgi:hypothetical protein
MLQPMLRLAVLLIAALVVQSADAAWAALPCAAMHGQAPAMAAMEHCAAGATQPDAAHAQHAQGDCCKDVASCAQSCGLPALPSAAALILSSARPGAAPPSATPMPAVGHSRNLLRPPTALLS